MKVSLFTQKYVVGAALFVSLFTVQAGAALAATTAALLPVGEGAGLAWVPSTGTVHYTLVDETTCNGVTDYVSETTVGDRDAYQVSVASVPTSATITGIALTPCASRNTTGGGSSVMNVFYVLNGAASADAGAYSLPTGTTPVALSATNFTGLSTVKNASTTLEVGVVYSSGTRGLRLSRMATVITYTPLPTSPNAPSALAMMATSSLTAAALSWTDNSSDETGFLVERSTDNVSFGLIGSTTANVRNYTDAGLATGTYYYRVRAVNAAGYSAYATSAQSVALTIPNAPSNTAASATTSTKVSVSWTDNSTNESQFVIERSLDNVSFAVVATKVGVGYVDTGLASSTTYYYRVRAINVLGTSTPSASASVTTLPLPIAPNAPSALTLTATTSMTGTSVSWTDNSTNETGFLIERSTDNVSFSLIGSTSANVRTFVNSSLAQNSYYYRVRATNSFGNSAYATASAPVLLTAPIAPSNITANWFVYATGTFSIGVTWDDNFSNQATFIVERSTDGVTFAQIAAVGKFVTAILDEPVASGTYYYRVSAVNDLGVASSSVVSITTP